MHFGFTDAWLLHSIHATERPESGADLKDIIGYADYINHAVMTYAEFSGALFKLVPLGLVVQVDKRLVTSEVYKNWWETKYAGRQRIDIPKALGEIRLFLNSTFEQQEPPPVHVHLQIEEPEFDAFIKEYVNTGS